MSVWMLKFRRSSNVNNVRVRVRVKLPGHGTPIRGWNGQKCNDSIVLRYLGHDSILLRLCDTASIAIRFCDILRLMLPILFKGITKNLENKTDQLTSNVPFHSLNNISFYTLTVVQKRCPCTFRTQDHSKRPLTWRLSSQLIALNYLNTIE